MRFLAIQRRLRQHFDALLLSENGGLAVAFLARTIIVAFSATVVVVGGIG